MKVEQSWPNSLWKVTLPKAVALGIKVGRAQTMSVDYSCIPLRFLEFVKLCQIHSCKFWLCENTGYFQIGWKWGHLIMRQCQYHFADQEQLKSLVEGKKELRNKMGKYMYCHINSGGFPVISTFSICKNSP